MIEIISEIVQKNGSRFAIIDSNNIRGSIHSFPTLSDLKNINKDFLKVGMLVYIEGIDKVYQLRPDYTWDEFNTLKDKLEQSNLISGQNIFLEYSKDSNDITINAVIGDIPENQVFSEDVIGVDDNILPHITIQTTSNPNLLKNKQDKTDDDLITEAKDVVGAINEVKNGMDELERDIIAKAIGAPASKDNTVPELSNHILGINTGISSAYNISGASAMPTLYEVFNALMSFSGGGTGGFGSSGGSIPGITSDKILHMYSYITNTHPKGFVYGNLREGGKIMYGTNGFPFDVTKWYDNIIFSGIYRGCS